MSEAEHICVQKYGGFLPNADSSDIELYKQLNEFMKLNQVDRCWLGIHEHTYSTPHWINSSAYWINSSAYWINSSAVGMLL